MSKTTRMLILGIGLLLGQSGAAAADSKVKGKVKTSAGEGVAGAAVELKDAESGHVYTLKTGKDGSFYQRGVLPASYTLKVELEGYTAHIIEDVRVQAGGDRSFEITLRSVAERQAEQLKKQGLEGYAQGADAFKKGDFETALAGADQQIAEKPEDAKGYDLKAKALISLKRYAEAIPLLEKELSLATPAADAQAALVASTFNAGIAAAKAEKNDEAIAYWEKAIVLGYDQPQVHRLLADSYLQKADFAKVKEHLELYLEKSPEAKDAAQVRDLLGEIQKMGAK
jgi:tetratricopeptide (TPR) repeat protein